MSLYNALFGQNKFANILLNVLGFRKEVPLELQCILEDMKQNNEDIVPAMIQYALRPMGRYRDIYLDGDKIVLYTRNGGGNRDEYQYVFDILKKHPNYLTDYDDDYDSTYAYIEFSIPEGFKEIIDKIKDEQGDVQTVQQKFEKAIEDLKAGKEPPQAVKDAMKELTEKMEKGEGGIVQI